jgi:hypothetical protein
LGGGHPGKLGIAIQSQGKEVDEGDVDMKSR